MILIAEDVDYIHSAIDPQKDRATDTETIRQWSERGNVKWQPCKGRTIRAKCATLQSCCSKYIADGDKNQNFNEYQWQP
jgi:hypothetical protein